MIDWKIYFYHLLRLFGYCSWQPKKKKGSQRKWRTRDSKRDGAYAKASVSVHELYSTSGTGNLALS